MNIKETVLDFGQNQYNINRAPQTWFTPETSRQVFGFLRENNLLEGVKLAWDFMVQQQIETEMGNLEYPPEARAFIDLVGAGLLSTGIGQLAQEKEVNPDHFSSRPLWQQQVTDMTLDILAFGRTVPVPTPA